MERATINQSVHKGLVSDCSTLANYDGKGLKALTDSRAAISLMDMHVDKMIEDHYKTSILLAAIHLKIVDGSPMALMGKVILHH